MYGKFWGLLIQFFPCETSFILNEEHESQDPDKKSLSFLASCNHFGWGTKRVVLTKVTCGRYRKSCKGIHYLGWQHTTGFCRKFFVQYLYKHIVTSTARRINCCFINKFKLTCLLLILGLFLQSIRIHNIETCISTS